MEQTLVKGQNHSSRWLIALGVLWLILAIAHLFYQLANPSVEVSWETATEIETAGFNIYRRSSPEGELIQINEAVGLIEGKGEAVSGAAYAFTDKNVEVGQTYYYVLEEVEYDMNRNRYEDEVFTYKVPYVTVWTAVMTATLILFGLALLVTGLKEERKL